MTWKWGREMDNDDMISGLLQLMASQTIHIGSIADECRKFIKSLKPYRTSETIATFGVLLTFPELQCNCIRLEGLAHLAALYASGTRHPDDAFVRQGFIQLGRTRLGALEDPSEDVFVSNICTSLGNFRILEGVWESAGFYLQRIVNLVEAMPDDPTWDIFRKPMVALLKLSDAVCQRSGLSRNMLGDALPRKAVPAEIKQMRDLARARLYFSNADIQTLGIDPKDLEPFIFDLTKKWSLENQIIGHTLLERSPISREPDGYYVLLPTAISATIRTYVYAHCALGGMKNQFIDAMAREYSELLSKTPLVGESMGAEVEFQQVKGTMLANIRIKVDKGRHLHLLFILDALHGFEETGLIGYDPVSGRSSDVIQLAIDMVYKEVSKQPDFRDGITLIVGCGIGRGAAVGLYGNDREKWSVDHMSVADLYTLSWVPRIKGLILWRIRAGREKLESLGVTLEGINGLLNLIAWVRSLNGHFIPHGEIPDDFIEEGKHAMIAIDQASVRNLRHEVLMGQDVHMELDTVGNWHEVRKEGTPLYPEDAKKPIYVIPVRSPSGSLPIVYVTAKRAWWCELQVPEGTHGHYTYQRWKMVSVWLSRIAPAIEVAFPLLSSGAILWVADFRGDLNDATKEPGPQTFQEVRQLLSVEVNSPRRTVRTIAAANYEKTHFNVENVAERALVDALVDGMILFSGEILDIHKKKDLVDSIVGSASARMTHAFRARDFRDFINHSDVKMPIKSSRTDDGALRLGLGWRVRNRSEGSYIRDKAECISFLNALVENLEDELCSDLRKFNRRQMVTMLLDNLERASVDMSSWEKTSAANMALHERKQEVREVMTNHAFELNALSLDCRVLLEMAICECPVEGAMDPGRLDLTRMMTKAGVIFMFGGWSDAIRWDAMEPTLRVTPLGDVHGNVDYVDQIIDPFGRSAHDRKIDGDIEDYAENLENVDAPGSLEDGPFPEFLPAFEEQAGVALVRVRDFVACIEKMGIDRQAFVFEVRKSELLKRVSIDDTLSPHAAAKAFDLLAFQPRGSWRTVPSGYEERDIQPWRFRRRLSVLRKPLMQITNDDDPLVVIAPGVVVDAWGYTVRNYLKGDFPNRQLKPLMKAWKGKVADENGRSFNEAVAKKLKELGWKVEIEIKPTKLLRMGFDRDYGDVDVLAWNPVSCRVLIIECKDLQYRKTYGEISEQLADFRGQVRLDDGKPDLLLKHLNRVELIRKHAYALKKYIGISEIKEIESHLVFRNPVPLMYALKHMQDKVKLHILDSIDIGVP